MSRQRQIALIQEIYNSMVHTHEIHIPQSGDPCTPYEFIFRDNIVNYLRKSIGVNRIEWDSNIIKIMFQSKVNEDLSLIKRIDGVGDILIKGENGELELIVEIKREFHPPYAPDVERIRDILLVGQGQSSIQYGIMAFAL